MKIVLIGPPASGKGTQSKKIVEEYSIPHISTGEIFRSLAKEGSELGVKAKEEYWGKGLLVPDEITDSLVKETLEKEKYKNGFLLDGYPRNKSQAEKLKGLVQDQIPVILKADKKTILERAKNRRICSNSDCNETYSIKLDKLDAENKCNKCGGVLVKRKDDESIPVRLEIYEKEIGGILEIYPMVPTISADGSIEEIWNNIKSYIDSQNP